MLKEERQKQLVDLINQEKVVAIADLHERLGVSYMTIWRDLEDLEREGLIERIRGGAVAKERHGFTIPGSFSLAQDPYATQKNIIGRYAAQNLVADGEFITIEAVTTTSGMMPYLQASNLTVLTNGLLTSMLAYQADIDVTIMCSGGILIETGAFIGPQAEDFFTVHRTHKAFFGASGFTLGDGFTDPTPLYMRIKKAMKENADQIIVLLDSSKIGVRSLLQVLALREVDIFVTDSGIQPDLVTALQNLGVEVHIAY